MSIVNFILQWVFLLGLMELMTTAFAFAREHGLVRPTRIRIYGALVLFSCLLGYGPEFVF